MQQQQCKVEWHSHKWYCSCTSSSTELRDDRMNANAAVLLFKGTCSLRQRSLVLSPSTKLLCFRLLWPWNLAKITFQTCGQIHLIRLMLTSKTCFTLTALRQVICLWKNQKCLQVCAHAWPSLKFCAQGRGELLGCQAPAIPLLRLAMFTQLSDKFWGENVFWVLEDVLRFQEEN